MKLRRNWKLFHTENNIAIIKLVNHTWDTKLSNEIDNDIICAIVFLLFIICI